MPTLSRLYDRYLSSPEKYSLRHFPRDDSSSEINLLRFLNSLFMKFQRSAPSDISSRIQALRTCVILNEQLAYLVRSHFAIYDPGSEIEGGIAGAVDDLAEEWKDA